VSSYEPLRTDREEAVYMAVFLPLFTAGACAPGVAVATASIAFLMAAEMPPDGAGPPLVVLATAFAGTAATFPFVKRMVDPLDALARRTARRLAGPKVG
jgi:hypothetical protein